MEHRPAIEYSPAGRIAGSCEGVLGIKIRPSVGAEESVLRGHGLKIGPEPHSCVRREARAVNLVISVRDVLREDRSKTIAQLTLQNSAPETSDKLISLPGATTSGLMRPSLVGPRLLSFAI